MFLSELYWRLVCLIKCLVEVAKIFVFLAQVEVKGMHFKHKEYFFFP